MLKSRLLLLMIALQMLFAGMADSQLRTMSKLQMPSNKALAIMITNTLIAYNQGNLTGDYSVLRELSSPNFRDANSSARLADVFRKMRMDAIDISPIVLFRPKLVRRPKIDQRGNLILEGFYDTRPKRVNFFLVFRPARNVWRLFAIQVSTNLAKKVSMAPNAAVSRRRNKLQQRKTVQQQSTDKPNETRAISKLGPSNSGAGKNTVDPKPSLLPVRNSRTSKKRTYLPTPSRRPKIKGLL